jgi:hypothetical protein
LGRSLLHCQGVGHGLDRASSQASRSRTTAQVAPALGGRTFRWMMAQALAPGVHQRAGTGVWTANTPVRKTQGDHLEHNVGHGTQSLSAFLRSLHLRAFLCPTVFIM